MRAPDDRPNFLVIVADDLGIDGVGAYGGGLETPRIDRLASEGLLFRNAYSTPLCTPSRVQLLTGRYPFRTRWLDNIQARLDEPDPAAPPVVDPSIGTFGQLLRDAGYATGCAGKWQLCRFDQHPDHVRALGFEESRCWLWVKWNEETQDFEYTSRYWLPSIIENGVVTESIAGRYGPDLYSEFLVDFMSRHRDEPFLAFYPMALPHPPFEMTPNELDPATVTEEPRPDALNFHRMVRYLDQVVGRLVDAVDELGLARNTLVLFLSDNGTPEEVRLRFDGAYRPGGKGTMSEKGMRVPMIARWPGVAAAGGVAHDLTDLSDVFPTLLELAGARAPASRVIDGHSLAPVLRGQGPSTREWVFSQLRDDRCARKGPWKLYSDGRLYNVERDPREREDLRDDPAAQRRRQQMQELLDSIGP